MCLDRVTKVYFHEDRAKPGIGYKWFFKATPGSYAPIFKSVLNKRGEYVFLSPGVKYDADTEPIPLSWTDSYRYASGFHLFKTVEDALGYGKQIPTMDAAKVLCRVKYYQPICEGTEDGSPWRNVCPPEAPDIPVIVARKIKILGEVPL